MNTINNLYKSKKNPKNTNKEFCIVSNSNSMNYSSFFHKKVLIQTKEKEYRTTIIRLNEDSLITLHNDRVFFKDIISIDIID